MANLKETAQWEDGIYRIEQTDPVVGGEDGIDNIQAKQLGNRTLYLKRNWKKWKERWTAMRRTCRKRSLPV